MLEEQDGKHIRVDRVRIYCSMSRRGIDIYININILVVFVWGSKFVNECIESVRCLSTSLHEVLGSILWEYGVCIRYGGVCIQYGGVQYVQ